MRIKLSRWGIFLFGIAGIAGSLLAQVPAIKTSAPLSTRKQLTLYQDSVLQAQAQSKSEAESRYLTQITSLYLAIKKNQEGIAYFNKWIKTNPKRLQTTAAATVYTGLGKLYLPIHYRTPALESFRKALGIYRKTNNRLQLAATLINEGIALNRLDQTTKAVKSFEEALILAKQLKNKELQRDAYGLLADDYKKLGRYKESVDYLANYTALDKQIRAAETKAKEKVLLHQTEESLQREEEAHRLADELEERSLKAESIAQEKDIIEFAGAKNPLVLIQNGEIQVVKGDRHSIGGKQKEEDRRFTRHVFNLTPRMHFYLFSDGYQDQFGGKDGQKFMVKRFYELIHEQHSRPMQKQLAALEDSLDNWMNGHRQIDDILVMGFRI